MPKNKSSKPKSALWERPLLIWSLVILSCLALGVVIVMVRGTMLGKIDSFDKCKTAGGAILESYPEQCLINGRTFVNKAQISNGGAYVGLSEQEALDKAKSNNVPARVVERDNESLPVTMDYVVGRHNLHVRDGHVYKVQVEGKE